MNDNSLYELTVDQTHMNIIIRALSNFMCSNYNGIDLEVVDVSKAMEEIKVASDIQLVLKHQLGKTRHTPKQTSQHTGLVWCKEINLDEYGWTPSELKEGIKQEYDGSTSYKIGERITNVRVVEDEQRQKELNDSVEYAKRCLDTFLKNQPKYDTEGGILSKSWNNVKERHWDTIKRMGDK